MVFHIKTDPTSPPGEVKSLFCQVVITQNGEPIVHNLGTGRLRIDKPLPPAQTAPTAPKTTVTSTAASSVRSRPLSRLEKLRQETRARAKSAAWATREWDDPHHSRGSSERPLKPVG